MNIQRKQLGLGLMLGLSLALPAVADEWKPLRLDGEIGLGVYGRQAIVHGESSELAVQPYVFAEYGRLFGRIDTFGVKTVAVGYGHVEISTRILQDGLQPDHAAVAGLKERQHSRPLGLSTFQRTPYGAFSLIALRDFGESKGNIVDANWTGKAQLATWLTVYPQVGAERLSAKYVDYQFGVRPDEAGYAPYRAGSTLNPYLAIYSETPLTEDLSLQLSWRQKWLGQGIADSPLVTTNRRWNAYAAVSYRFR